MLCTLATAAGCRLQHCKGNLADEELSALLKAGMTFDRIPMGYARVSTDDLSVAALAEVVCQEIVSFAVRQQYRFTVKELCGTLLQIWGRFDQAKQTQIASAISRVVKELSSSDYCGRWLKQTRGARTRLGAL